MPDPTPSTPRDDFTQSFDARVWARAFLDTVREHPEVPTDEQTMLGWFANALMRGYDEHTWKMQRDSAALAASAGPLAAEKLVHLRAVEDAHEDDFSQAVYTALKDYRTAYTALAAECAQVTKERDRWMGRFDNEVHASNKLSDDLAALRATVAEACALLKEHGGHSSSAVKDFLARTPTPEGQG